MRLTALKRTAAACVAALACAGVLSACEKAEDAGIHEPAREGLALELGGLEYNVFITRQLNLAITPDSDYYSGPPARPGHALFGIFIQVCNAGDEPAEATEDFTVLDNQENEFKPLELPEENAFAYHPAELEKDECIPAVGSAAQQGPTAGSMLLFDFPLQTTENRPLELEIEAGGEKRTVELDI